MVARPLLLWDTEIYPGWTSARVVAFAPSGGRTGWKAEGQGWPSSQLMSWPRLASDQTGY